MYNPNSATDVEKIMNEKITHLLKTLKIEIIKETKFLGKSLTTLLAIKKVIDKTIKQIK